MSLKNKKLILPIILLLYFSIPLYAVEKKIVHQGEVIEIDMGKKDVKYYLLLDNNNKIELKGNFEEKYPEIVGDIIKVTFLVDGETIKENNYSISSYELVKKDPTKIQTFEGKVKVALPEPNTICYLEIKDDKASDNKEKTIKFIGKLRYELMALSGITLRIKAKFVKGNSYRVIDYEILDVGNKNKPIKPIVGKLYTEKNKLFIKSKDGNEYLIVGSMVNELKKHNNAKVWVTGRIEKDKKGDKIKVDSYSIIIE